MTQRTALVTGGCGGIGSAVCRALTDQGRRVVAGYLPGQIEQAQAWQAGQRQAGYDIDIVAGDVASFESCREMVEEVKHRYGGVDILVNCAGITADQTLRKMAQDQWKIVIQTNLDSVFNVTRQVIDEMVGRGFGRVVNISSVNGQKGQFGQTNYSAAKAGMHGFTMALAQEVARNGVTVNSVSPGYVVTGMTEAIPEAVRETIIAGIPMGRMGQANEVADAVGFLCADETSYITGANLPVNGGMYMS